MTDDEKVSAEVDLMMELADQFLDGLNDDSDKVLALRAFVAGYQHGNARGLTRGMNEIKKAVREAFGGGE